MDVEREPPLDALDGMSRAESAGPLEDMLVEEESSLDKTVAVESQMASPEPTLAQEKFPEDENISPVVQEVVSPLVVPSSSVDREPSPIVDEEPVPRYHYSIDSLPLNLIEVILQFIPDVASLHSSALVCQRFSTAVSRHPEWFVTLMDEEVSPGEQEPQTSEESPGQVEMEVVEESSLESPVLSDASRVVENRETSPALEHTDISTIASQEMKETAQPDLPLDDTPTSELELHAAPAQEELFCPNEPPSHPGDVLEDAMDVDPLPDVSESQVVEEPTLTSESIFLPTPVEEPTLTSESMFLPTPVEEPTLTSESVLPTPVEGLPAPVEGPTLQEVVAVTPAVGSVPVQESTVEVLEAPIDDVWIAPTEPTVPAPPLEVLEEETRESDVDDEMDVQEPEQTLESAEVPAVEVYEEEDASGEFEDVDEAVGEDIDDVVEQEQVAGGAVEEHSQVQQIDEGIEVDEEIEKVRVCQTPEVETIAREQPTHVREIVEAEIPEVEMATREQTSTIPEVEPILQEVEEVQPPEISEPELTIGEQASGLPGVEPIEEIQPSELETTSMEQTQVEPIVEEVEEVSSVPEVEKSTSETSSLHEPPAAASAPEAPVQINEIEATSTTQADHSPDNRTQDLIEPDFLLFGALPPVAREQEAPIVPLPHPALEKPVEPMVAPPRPENWDNTFLPTPPQENHEQFHAELLDYANQAVQSHVQHSMTHSAYANQDLQTHSMTHTDVFDYGQGFSNYDDDHLTHNMPGVHGSDHLYPTAWSGMQSAGSPKLPMDGAETYPYWRPERESVDTAYQQLPHNTGQPSYSQMDQSLERGPDIQLPEASGSGSSSSTGHSQSPLFTPPELGMWTQPEPFTVHYQSPTRRIDNGLHPLAFTSRDGKAPAFQFHLPLNYPPIRNVTPPTERAPVSSHEQVLVNHPPAFHFPPSTDNVGPGPPSSSRDDEERAQPASFPPGLDSQGKACPSCTFINADIHAKCTVCETRLGRGSRASSTLSLGAGAFPRSLSQPRKTSRNGSLRTASVVSSRSNSVVDTSPAKASSNGRLTPQLSVNTALPASQIAGPSVQTPQSGNAPFISPLSSLNSTSDQEADFKKPAGFKGARKSAVGNEAGPSTGKRKRAARVNRKTSAASVGPKEKGKQKETSTPIAAAAKKTKRLTNHRRLTSRASSIISTATDNSDTTTVPASTPTRPPQRPASSKPSTFWPSSLLHGNTHAQPRRHQHHLPTGPVAGAAGGSTNVYYSSPVTRSNCRYRRISLPIEEEGPRIQFLVPGCSLGDAELMEDEEIVDHGDATVEESTRVVSDIENLDFNAYLIGVIRQLVGLDLLREQEVYYLPKIGEDPLQYKKKRRGSGVSESSPGRRRLRQT
ncbi:hypothetical protein BDZ89DRAFT_381981 [Hymenopellis radicata]|nr:hypothetical protein BDZ89DRAFT_381981 [Hymenopellis radicata]